MELIDLQNAVLNKLAEKLCDNDLSKFGLQYQLKGKKLLFAVDTYYFIAVKKKDGEIFLKCKTLGMTLEAEWFLVIDKDRLVQRITKLLLAYMMKDRDIRN